MPTTIITHLASVSRRPCRSRLNRGTGRRLLSHWAWATISWSRLWTPRSNGLGRCSLTISLTRALSRWPRVVAPASSHCSRRPRSSRLGYQKSRKRFRVCSVSMKCPPGPTLWISSSISVSSLISMPFIRWSVRATSSSVRTIISKEAVRPLSI